PAQGVIELHAQHPVYTSGKQGLNFFPQTHQARGRLVTGKKLMWLGLKYDDHRGQLMRFSSLRQLTQYRLVTEMNAVKRADGGDTAAMPGTQVMQTANEYRGRRSHRAAKLPRLGVKTNAGVYRSRH